MKKIGIVANLSKRYVLDFVKQLVAFLREKNNYELYLEQALKDVDHPLEIPFLDLENLVQEVDLLIVLGGDGTLLSVVPYVTLAGPEIMGVNMGHLGFLTEFDRDGLYEGILNWEQGKYRVKERMLLEVNQNSSHENHLVLNEAVITKGSFARIVCFDVIVDDQYFTTYRSDGLIISTPSGSTAYSLSSGGPISEPEISLILMTPICPHTLSNRPLILSDQRKIQIQLKSEVEDAGLTLDGRINFHVSQGDQIQIQKSEIFLKMVQGQRSFLSTLKEKLGWSSGVLPSILNPKTDS